MPPPVITIVSPAPGTPLDPAEPIVFTVTSGVGLLSVFVAVKYPGIGTTEVVLLPTLANEFTDPYFPTSTLAFIAGGAQATIRRSPIWPDAPTLYIVADDTTGGRTSVTDSWPLAAPPVLPAPGAVVPVFPTTGPASGAPAVDHDQAYYLAVFDRILDSTWLVPLKLNSNSGYEILQAFAKVGARVSDAIANLERGSIIVYAKGGARASVTVEFVRADASHGDVIVKAGTIVTTSSGGRDFVTTQDASFTGGALGPIAVTALAIAPGWQWNVKGKVITSRGEVLAGEIDTVRAFVQTAPAAPDATTFIDPTITVQQIADATGGADPMLDGLGADRGVIRSPGETDAAYALRIRTLPDTISPGAVKRATVAFFQPYGLSGTFLETFQASYQTCWDAPAGIHIPGGFDSDLFTYDDPRPTTPFENRWLDELEYAGAFVVVVPNFQTLTDYGTAWDDDAASNAATIIQPPLNGQRAVAAYDLADLSDQLPWCYDGFDAQKQAVYAAFWQLLQQIKAGGTAAIIELAGQ